MGEVALGFVLVEPTNFYWVVALKGIRGSALRIVVRQEIPWKLGLLGDNETISGQKNKIKC